MNIPLPITISPVLNGYVVQVGCQKVVFNDREAMIAELRAYLDNPGAKQLAFIAKAMHRELLQQPATPMPNPEYAAANRAVVIPGEAPLTQSAQIADAIERLQ